MQFQSAACATFAASELAIALSKGAFGHHLGIAFHSAKDGVKLLHLARHQELRVDPFPPSFFCITSPIALPPIASRQMVAVVRSQSKRLPRINYGLDFLAAKGSFRQDGRYSPPKGSDGLTCATFVSTLFGDHKLPLVEERTWQPNENNVAWGENVCRWLAESGVPDEHVEAVRKNVNGLRVRPEEVAGAAASPYHSRPIAFGPAQDIAAQVVGTYHELVAAA